MATKQVKGVIVPRHDTEANWNKATNFIPKMGELIVYDPDETTQISRFKFGRGVIDANGNLTGPTVNELPFVTTENSGGEGGFTEEEIIEIIKEYSENEAAAIVYLNTKQHVGEHLELPDVYPLQAKDTILRVISKNCLVYNFDEQEMTGTGIKFSTNGKKYLTVSGTAKVNLGGATHTISRTTIQDIPGKYTLKVDNNGIDTDTEKCYLSYYLINADGKTVKERTKLTTDAVVIDTEELNCTDIYIEAYIKINSSETLQTQNFKIQINYGDEVLEYTNPVSTESYANRSIDVYGRNLFDAKHSSNTDFTTVRTDVNIYLSEMEIGSLGNRLGLHYFKGTMNEDNFIGYVEDGVKTRRLYTPLLTGDKFTLIYNVTGITGNVATINNVQIVYGHTDYEKYNPFVKATTVSDSDGNCDISKLRYPYSFLSLLGTSEEQKRFTIYIQYDPALSRNWTEKQLSNIDSRFKDIEEILDTPTTSDVIVDDKLDSTSINPVQNKIITKALNSINNKFIFSEEEPTDVPDGTIWIKPV